MRILSVDIEFGAHGGGSVERNYRICTHLLALGADPRLLVLSGAHRMVAFPDERVTSLPTWNRRYNVPSPQWRQIDAQVRQADVVYFASYLWGAAPLAWLAARRHRKPWVICPAGVLPFFGRSIALKRACQALYGHAMLRDAAALVGITPDEVAHLRHLAGQPQRVVRIANGVDIEAVAGAAATPAELRAALGIGPVPFLLFLGRHEHVKGIDLLLHALARLPDAQRIHAVIAGDGLLRGELQQLAAGLGIADRVAFAGWLGPELKRAALRDAAFVAIPSRRDAMTLVVLEAAIAGKPVLLTRQCGFDAVDAVDGGVIVDADVDALAYGLQRLQQRACDWDAMGQRMRALALRDYGWDGIARQYLQLFERVIDGR